METASDPVREAARAAAEPYLTNLGARRWAPLFIASYLTAIFGALALIVHGHSGYGFYLQFPATVAFLVYLNKVSPKWGTAPKLRSAPAEIKGTVVWIMVAFIVAAAISAASWYFLGWPAGLVAIFVTAFGVCTVHDRVIFPRAVQRVRDRLA